MGKRPFDGNCLKKQFGLLSLLVLISSASKAVAKAELLFRAIFLKKPWTKLLGKAISGSSLHRFAMSLKESEEDPEIAFSSNPRSGRPMEVTPHDDRKKG